MSDAILERALRRVCKADGHDPDELFFGEPRWCSYICAEQRIRVFAEIDADRNGKLFALAVFAIIFFVFVGLFGAKP